MIDGDLYLRIGDVDTVAKFNKLLNPPTLLKETKGTTGDTRLHTKVVSFVNSVGCLQMKRHLLYTYTIILSA